MIPNFNRRSLLESVLADLSRQTCPPDQVIVVDNGSRDDSVAVAKAAGATVVELGENTGFCRAVNEGVRAAKGEFIAVLNNDVELPANWLERLFGVVKSTDAWFATGKIYRWGEKDTIDGTYDAISRAGCAWRCGENCPDGPLWSSSCKISLAPFTAALFRADLFQQVGLLDERFESYLEDVDFGLRCATKGLSGRYLPEATCSHRGSATLGQWDPRKVRLMARNQLLLVAKHYPRRWWLRLGWPVLVGQMLWGLVAARHGTAMAFWKGKLDALRMFSTVRNSASDEPKVLSILRESEDRIRQLQEASGFDRYWRAYFALT